MKNQENKMTTTRLPQDNHLFLDPLHPAGTSKDSDKCDLSKDSEIALLTLGSMDNSFFYHLFCFTQESYLSKDLGEIYIYGKICRGMEIRPTLRHLGIQ